MKSNAERARLSYFDILAFVALAVLAWAPFPLGSNRPMPAAVLALLVGAIGILWIAAAMFKRPYIAWPWSIRLAGMLVVAVLCWSWVQTVPWTPPSWHHPVWQLVQDGNDVAQGYVAINLLAPTEAQLNLMASIGAFAIFFLLARRSRRTAILLNGMLIVIAAYAVLGIYMIVSGWRPFDDLVQANFITSTIVNRNHFATYVNIGIMIALSIIFTGNTSTVSDQVAARTLTIRSLAAPLEKYPVHFALLGILIAALLGTQSRGGFLSLMCGMLAFALLQTRANASSSKFTIISLVGFAALLGFVIFLIGEPLLSRFDLLANERLDSGGRLAAWSLTVELISQRPWLGYGHGAYFDLFMMNVDERFRAAFDHAHNDYLEILAELGIPAGVALIMAPVLIVLQCARNAGNASKWQRKASMAAILSAVVVGVHALVDFSLTIPAVAVTFAAIIGIGAAQTSATQ